MPVLTAPQLDALRSSPHTSTWLCVPIVPSVVFAAQIAGSPAIGAVTIPYDAVTSGAFGNVLKGMTLHVGSVAGASDIAIMRIRLNADATNLYVAWNSDVAWSDDLYLTVLQQYLPWTVRQRIVPPTIYKDYNIAYTDQTDKWPPVAMMGDCVCKLFTANPTPVYFDGSESYAVAPGATITGYAWAFGDGGTSAVATPGNHNYTAAGTYYASLTVTDSNGKTHLTRRIVSLPDPTTVYTVNFENTSLEAQIDDGWKGKIRVFDPSADEAHFPDRAPCFLISNDTFGGVAGSVGFPQDRENIVLFGYIVEDSVAVQPLYNELSFDIESIAGVMAKADSPPVFLSDSANPAGNPDAWAWGKNLNVLRGLVYLLKFHSTVMDIADVELYNDSTLTKAVDYPQDSLWNMLVQFGKGKRLMHTGVTRTGRIIVGRNPNLIPTVSRGSVVTVMQLEQGDWKEQVTIPQKPYPTTSFLCLSGLAYDGNPSHEPDPLFGMSPGRPPKDYGSEKELQYLKLVDQYEANQLAGLLVGTDNMDFGEIVIPMRGNWVKVFDPARQEYIITPSGGFVTKRGVLLDTIPLIVRRVSVKFDRSGVMSPTLSCEYYSQTEVAVDGDCFPPDAPPPPQRIIPPIVPPPPPRSLQPGPVMTTHSNTCSGGVSTTVLNWTYAGTGSPVYYVERSVTSPLSGFSLIGTTSGLSYTDTAMAPGRVYYYRVHGYVGGLYTRYGTVVTQAASFCTITLSLSVPDCITADLTWTAVSGATTYHVERSGGSGYSLIATVGSGVLAYNDLPTPRGVYSYRVKAYNAYTSSAYSNVVTGTLGKELFTTHVIMATANHVYEFSGDFGIGYTLAPDDITGNITGTIIGMRRSLTGNLLILTSTNVWWRVSGSTWGSSTSAEDWAANSSLWSHWWWNEDGTGPHGLDWYGASDAPLSGCLPHVDDFDPHIHWHYLAFDNYKQLVGDNVIAEANKIGAQNNCSARGKGIWSTPIDGTGEPTSYGLLPDSAQPDIYTEDNADNFVLATAPHFTPYADEFPNSFVAEYHLAYQELHVSVIVPNPSPPPPYLRYNGDVGTGTAPCHFTDDYNRLWAWGGKFSTKVVRKEFEAGPIVFYFWLTADDSYAGPMSLNVPPGIGETGMWTGVAIRYITPNGGGLHPNGHLYKSIDGGTTWSTHPTPAGADAIGIYTVEGVNDQLYVTDINGNIWLSSDEGAHWCKVYSGPSEPVLGFLASIT